jgi:hypothetical protein
MSTSSPDDLVAFNAFVDQRLGGDLNGTSLEDALADFRAYEADLARLRAHLKPSIEQAARGELGPVDVDSLMRSVRERIECERRGE